MDWRQLQEKFVNFLKVSKDYKDENLLFHPISSKRTIKYRPDLVIVEELGNQKIAVVEFKILDTILRPKEQIRKYLEDLKSPNAVAYIVLGTDNDEFKIFELIDNDWKLISPEKFPTYSDLVERKMSRDLIESIERHRELTKEFETRKKNNYRLIGYLSTSVIIGLTVVIIFTLLYSRYRENEELLTRIQNKEVEIRDVMKQIEKLKTVTTPDKIDTLLTTQSIDSLNHRITVIEDGISSNPEKTLALININNNIQKIERSVEEIKNLNELKYQAFEDKLEGLNTWVNGIIITIMGAILSTILAYIVPDWFKKKSTD